jgi:hypothetical protein
LFKRLENETHLPLVPFDNESYKKPNIYYDYEKHNEVMQKIKDEHRPIRLKEIRKFARKIKKLTENRKTKRLVSEQSSSYSGGRYTSKFTRKYLEEEKLLKLQQESQERSKIDLVNKKKKFSQIISVAFKPKISQKKK